LKLRKLAIDFAVDNIYDFAVDLIMAFLMMLK